MNKLSKDYYYYYEIEKVKNILEKFKNCNHYLLGNNFNDSPIMKIERFKEESINKENIYDEYKKLCENFEICSNEIINLTNVTNKEEFDEHMYNLMIISSKINNLIKKEFPTKQLKNINCFYNTKINRYIPYLLAQDKFKEAKISYISNCIFMGLLDLTIILISIAFVLFCILTYIAISQNSPLNATMILDILFIIAIIILVLTRNEYKKENSKIKNDYETEKIIGNYIYKNPCPNPNPFINFFKRNFSIKSIVTLVSILFSITRIPIIKEQLLPAIKEIFSWFK